MWSHPAGPEAWHAPRGGGRSRGHGRTHKAHETTAGAPRPAGASSERPQWTSSPERTGATQAGGSPPGRSSILLSQVPVTPGRGVRAQGRLSANHGDRGSEAWRRRAHSGWMQEGPPGPLHVGHPRGPGGTRLPPPAELHPAALQGRPRTPAPRAQRWPAHPWGPGPPPAAAEGCARAGSRSRGLSAARRPPRTAACGAAAQTGRSLLGGRLACRCALCRAPHLPRGRDRRGAWCPPGWATPRASAPWSRPCFLGSSAKRGPRRASSASKSSELL